MPGFSNETLPECRICRSDDLQGFVAKEMMFGTREPFRYHECGACGCVQIAAYLENIAEHYPPNYYSYQESISPDSKQANAVLKDIAQSVKRTIMAQSDTIRSRFLRSASTQNWLQSRPVPNLYLKYVPDADMRILDVGCGSGGLLRTLDALYYRNLHGVDPFISKDVTLNGRLLVKKANMADLEPSYECISFHHVLEHMPDQVSVLQAAHALLAPQGLVIVRIPVVAGYAWRTYRQNWVQLDPPRHYYLHSEGSFRMLAAQARFQVSSIEYDSTGFQFWGSELYLRDIPLMGTGRPEDSKSAVFSADLLDEYEKRAVELNKAGDGDQIVAILRKV